MGYVWGKGDGLRLGEGRMGYVWGKGDGLRLGEGRMGYVLGKGGWASDTLKLTVNFPKFGFCFPAKIFKAVDFPIPFVPTSPRTTPGRGIGRRCSLKELAL